MDKKRYSKDFRCTVAIEALKPEFDGLEYLIAKKYDLRTSTVIRWKQLYQEYGTDGFAKKFPTLKDKEKKSQREIELEKENIALKEEVEILKKAAAFLANVKRE